MAKSTITTIADHLPEKSTAVFTASFKDEDGQATVPTAATWTLSDKAGAIINSRDSVTITSLAESVDIVLSGDDLAISSGFDGRAEERVLTIEGTYTSDLGSGLPIKAECRFFIDSLIAVD